MVQSSATLLEDQLLTDREYDAKIIPTEFKLIHLDLLV